MFIPSSARSPANTRACREQILLSSSFSQTTRVFSFVVSAESVVVITCPSRRQVSWMSGACCPTSNSALSHHDARRPQRPHLSVLLDHSWFAPPFCVLITVVRYFLAGELYLESVVIVNRCAISNSANCQKKESERRLQSFENSYKRLRLPPILLDLTPLATSVVLVF